jgi:hypothetical protein
MNILSRYLLGSGGNENTVRVLAKVRLAEIRKYEKYSCDKSTSVE